MDWRRTAKEAAAIVGLALVPALVLNFGLIRRQLRGDFAHSLVLPEGTAGVAFIGLAEAGDLFQSGDALFVDNRSGEVYAAGHIPGALSVPFKDAVEGAIPLDPGALKTSPDRPLVVYCEGGDCQTSVLVTQLLKKAGFGDVRIFEGGWTEWEGAGFPVEVGLDQE
ncbi:MAG: rhodanese-like domain-containing protein [Candidatus Aminicenantes bacterium]|nr:rhodanese-like domain-containing protein [Candidatus Aminicenantes bacterium]